MAKMSKAPKLVVTEVTEGTAIRFSEYNATTKMWNVSFPKVAKIEIFESRLRNKGTEYRLFDAAGTEIFAGRPNAKVTLEG